MLKIFRRDISNQDFGKFSLIFSIIFITVIGLFYLLFFNIFNILLIVFAGILLGILFIMTAKFIESKLKFNYTISVSLAIVSILSITTGLSFLIGNSLKSQMVDLIDKVPVIIDKIDEFINKNSLGYINSINWENLTDDFNGKQSQFAKNLFSSSFGFFGDIYSILIISIFVAISPKTYYSGLINLLPQSWKSNGKSLINNVFSDLKVWLQSQLLEMLIMFVMTAIGLYVLGVDFWLILALLTALLCFIPNIGPMIALFPMVAVGFLDSPQTALWVFITFMIIQIIETGAIGPYIRAKMLSLPPALVILFQLIFGSFSGILGILLATPILVVIMVLVRDLYIKKINNYDK